jgi:hypothetical protein
MELARLACSKRGPDPPSWTGRQFPLAPVLKSRYLSDLEPTGWTIFQVVLATLQKFDLKRGQSLVVGLAEQPHQGFYHQANFQQLSEQ